MSKICFASDNYAGIHPDICQAILSANIGPAIAYGNDDYTAKAYAAFQRHFGESAQVFFVFNGTGANVTALSSLLKPYQAILSTALAHIQVDECGAPEKISGSKLLIVPERAGKLVLDDLKPYFYRIGDQHHVQPKVISISQSTEYGTVYRLSEIKAIADFAHDHHLFLHMDGARISNACAFLQTDFKAMTRDAGVDVVSFGGTKNGMMLGEAVIFFDATLAQDFLFVRKQNMQLASKMRFIAAQFSALLSDGLWLNNALHANKMAMQLAERLQTFSEISITKSVEANAIFAIFPKKIIEKLQEKYYFYVWNEMLSEVRLMTSFQTTEEEVQAFANDIKSALG